MAPATLKSEGDMADAIERWLEGLRTLAGQGYAMSYKLKVAALKTLMVARAKDQY